MMLLIMAVMAVQAQVNFSVKYKRVNATTIDIVFTGTAQPGWHIYSTNIGEGGPTRAQFGVDKIKGAKLKGALKAGPGAKTMQDPIFEMPVTFFEGHATFTQRVELLDKDYELKGISEEFRGNLSHLVTHAVTQRIDAHLEQINCHPMEIRRYYRQFDY